MERTLRVLLLILVGAVLASPQVTITPINPSDPVVSVSLPEINADFVSLNGKQIIMAGLPSSSFCIASTVGTLYIRSDADAPSKSFFVCIQVSFGTYVWEGPYGPVIAGAPGIWPAFAAVALSGSYLDLSNKPTTSQITESGNLYFTNARAQAAMAGLYEPPIATAATTKFWRGDKTFVTADTSIVPENGNLYFTDARAQAALSGLYQPLIVGSPSAWPVPVSQEAPSGSINGSNDVFTLAHVPLPGSLLVTRNGLAQDMGMDYNLNSTTGVITFVTAATPQSGDRVLAWYQYSSD
jgi:hypothetical protein